MAETTGPEGGGGPRLPDKPGGPRREDPAGPGPGPWDDDGTNRWTEYYWDGFTWRTKRHSGSPPPREAWVATTQGGQTHWTLAEGPEGDYDNAVNVGRKYEAEIEAGKYATIDGRDVYVATDAEEAAQRAGLNRDQRGYYKFVNGQKVYETDIDPESGRRFHYEMEEGVRKQVYDDLEEWPLVYGTPEELRKQLLAKRSTLARLREQYRNTRADSWVVRDNLLDKIADLEDEVMGLNRALGADPVGPVTHVLNPNEDAEVDPHIGLSVALSFAIFDPLVPELSFSAPLVGIPNGAHVVVRAAVTQSQRYWKPGKVRSPDVLRVKWDPPTDYLALDNVPSGGTDEFLSSQTLMLMRDFRAPSVGNTNAGRGTSNTFGVQVWQYELAQTEIEATPHNEGDDGYFGAVISPDNPVGGAPGGTLAQFMEALCIPESNCNHFRPDGVTLRVNPNTGAFGKWQIMPGNWANWAHDAMGTPKSNPPPKTEANCAVVAYWKAGKIYSHQHSWRKVCVVWHSGAKGLRQHPDAGLPGSGRLEKYVRQVLTAAGLPMD